jgi:hypothetical protein
MTVCLRPRSDSHPNAAEPGADPRLARSVHHHDEIEDAQAISYDDSLR